jgi:hypothetical protein
MKMSLLPLLIFGLYFSLLIEKVAPHIDDKYNREERLFLDQFFTSDLIGNSRNPEARLLNKPKAIYLEGTLHSFEDIGITKESIRDFVGVKLYEDLALDLDSKKIDFSHPRILSCR